MRCLAVCLPFLLAWVAASAAGRTEIPDAVQPQLCAASDGVVWLTYGRGGAVFVAKSNDAGATFSPGRQVGDLTDLRFGMRQGPRIVAQGDRVTVTVVGEELLAYASRDGGQSWTGPVTINDAPASASEGLHDLAVAPDGRLFVTWLDQRNGAMQVWGAESTDGGRSWAKNRLVYRSPEKSVCECCHPSALYDGEGNLAVMWRNSMAGSRDLWMAFRHKGQAEFSAGQKLGQGTWPLNACPMDGGRIVALGGGKFATVWQRAGEVYYAPLEGAETRLGQGRQPVAVVRAGATTVYWQDGTDLVGREVGATAAAPIKLAAHARFAAAVSSGATAVLAYEQGSGVAASAEHGPGSHGEGRHPVAAEKTSIVVVERR